MAIEGMNLGKVPPQAIDLERAVLGAILQERSKMQDVMGIIPNSGCFYVHANQLVYDAILETDRFGFPVDILSVMETLKKNGNLELSGGAMYLADLTYDVVSSAHVESHARMVMEKYFFRELIRSCGELITRAYNDESDVFELLSDAEKAISDISGTNISQAYKNAPRLAHEAKQEQLINSQRTSEFTGIDTGFQYLNARTKGWQDTNLIIVAARPAVGKTSFILNIAMNAVLSEQMAGIGLFSLEMSSKELMKRILSSISGIPLDNVMDGRLSRDEQTKFDIANEMFSKLNFKIDDCAALNLLQLKSKARKMVTKDGVKMIIIDYLQLMSGMGNDKVRENVISEISRGLKSLAKELSVPIIALSQLNRESEKNKRVPMLSDLRESGAIEQDADIVIFLHGPSPNEQDAETGEFPDRAKIVRYLNIAKNRSGDTATEKLHFNMTTQKWSDFDESLKYGGFAMPKQSVGYRDPSEGSKLFIEKGALQNDAEPPF